MGREIRRVPGDWEHPRYTADNARDRSRIGDFIPMFNADFKTAAEEWLKNCDLWRAGKHDRQKDDYWRACAYYWEYDTPPDAEHYRERKWSEAEATHWVVYETVSEGTPVTPAFPTAEALVEFLSTEKDFWGDGPWPRKTAENFVREGYVPSMIVNRTEAGTSIKVGIGCAADA